jgi:gamma-glutamyltranspeptidase/glutathione hydrolase
MVSQALKILAGFDTRDQNCNVDERSHLVAETLKLAMADRFRYFGDPDFNSITVDELLADEYISLRRELINPHQAQTYGPGDPLSCRAKALPADDGAPSSTGTTTCTVADKFGNVVTVTPSGCGSMAGAAGTTGIIHGARLSQFVQQSGHANSIACLKRPCITPSPTMVLKDGKPLIAASMTWGNNQDQLALILIVELVSHGLCFDDTITSQQVMHPCILMTPFRKYQQGEIMIPVVRQRSAQHLIRMGHNAIRKNWHYQWSVIHFDPSNGQPRTWAGTKPG